MITFCTNKELDVSLGILYRNHLEILMYPQQQASMEDPPLLEHRLKLSTYDEEETVASSDASSDLPPAFDADVLMNGFPVPLFFKEETRDAIFNFGSVQVSKLKHKAMLAQDEFRESVVQAHSLQVQAEQLKRDYHHALAAYRYFQLTLTGDKIYKHREDCENCDDREDTILVPRPGNSQEVVDQPYLSDLPRIIRKLPDAKTFIEQGRKAATPKYTVYEASRLYALREGSQMPMATASCG
ncbi:hypothetical protein HWV62_28413 [Athelia sp. TMB]|nr:hypothetical protein HWV62_28413 [Athelia sp. TMB]